MLTILKNFDEIATLKGAHQKDGRGLFSSDLGLIKNATIVHDEIKILWVGPDRDLPNIYRHQMTTSCQGLVCLPEIIDSHTHLIFGGDRAFEYSMKLNGESYENIAKNGGGILNTTKSTQEMSENDLFETSRKRIESIYQYGVGTIEIKSGYGLSFEKEYQLSKTIDRLKKYFFPRIQIFNTFMAAHAVPSQYSSSHDYINQVVIPLLEKLHQENIIDAVDIFHEQNYFSKDDVQLLFSKAKEFGISTKIHADEFNDNKGACLAVFHKSLSCDHLLCTDEDGISALQKSSTVATLLPGTGLFLGKKMANGRRMLDQKVKVAMASDFNPGSCHCDNLLLLASIAAPMYKMNMAELWASITLNAAHALNLKNQGAILEGLKPRFSIFSTSSVDHITYSWGKNLSKNKELVHE